MVCIVQLGATQHGTLALSAALECSHYTMVADIKCPQKLCVVGLEGMYLSEGSCSDGRNWANSAVAAGNVLHGSC